MDKNRMIGVSILAGSVLGIIVYGWLLYAFSTTVLQITALVAVGSILGLFAWIGWTMATAPPASIENTATSRELEAAGEPTSSGSARNQTDTTKP